MKRSCWIGILVLLALAACDSATREAQRMVKRAELLADTLPDSTARLIDSVLRMPVYFSERQRMEIAMLQGEALFSGAPFDDEVAFDSKLDQVFPSPELEHASEYYGKKKQYAKAAHAALYNGYVQQHYNEKTLAMQSYKAAERYGDLVNDSLTVAQAKYQMGKMLYYDNLSQESLALLKSANQLFGNRNIENAMTLNMMAVCHLVLGDYENAESSLQQSLMYAEKSHADKVKRKILNNYAVLFRLKGEYEQAINCLQLVAKESDLDETKLLLLYMNLGDVFFDTHEMDSATLYYKLVDSLLPIAHAKMETKASAYSSLSQFAENRHDNTQALYYWKQYNKWINVIRDKQEQNNIYGIQRRYDYGVLQNSMNQKIIIRQRLVVALSIVAVLVLLAFTISQVRLLRIKKQEAEIKAILLRFMKQNEELIKQSEVIIKEHHDLEQKHQKTEEAYQNLAFQAEKYRNAFETSDKKLSKALLKEQQIMQKMAVYLDNKNETALFEALKYSVLGNQEYWEAMLKTFDKQFPGLRKELALQHPELTETEQKILLLSYVDASREDTALLLDTSIYMVDKLRTSVKKKMASDGFGSSQKA